MARRWTAEERARQAELIRRHRPWERSTGPRTAAGKAAVRLNALKHGGRRAEVMAFLRRCAASACSCASCAA